MTQKHNTSLNLMRALCIGVVCFMLGQQMLGQSTSPPFTLSETHTPLQTLSLSDIDINNFQNSTWLFTLDIRVASPPAPAQARIKGNFNIRLADGREFPDAVNFRTVPFIVNAPRTLTNLDLGRNTPIPTDIFTYSTVAKNTLRDIALSTGQFPAGTYTAALKLVDDAEAPLSNEVIIVFNIEGFARIELLAPQDGSETPSLPFLEWLYQGPNVTLLVGERRSGESKEEALAHEPLHIRQTLEGQSSFQIPPAGTRPFESGHTYAWTVVAISRGASGVETSIQGQIWEFTIGGAAGPNSFSSNLINQIEQLLGSEFGNVSDLIANQNLSPSGRFIAGDVNITLEELRQLLNQLMQDRDRILAITIE